MPPRKIYKQANGLRCVKTIIDLYPTRDDLIAAVTRDWSVTRLCNMEPELPETQKALLDMFQQAALAGEIGEHYPASDEELDLIEARVDSLFPALRELPE